MDKDQELEWLEAQKIAISVDLIAAAKQQLQFLAVVDRNRCLYDGPALNRAINRYKRYWLPLLSKYGDADALGCPLVVPLDCEWIWHCHRLNPVQYKEDCEKFYGRVLDNNNVISTLQGTIKQKTEEIWTSLYPDEPYELDLSNPILDIGDDKISESVENIKYDLVSAVKRQSVFFYQVSRPNMHDDRFLDAALARYKGFLHLIKRNGERSRKLFCVPTYDIDLMWHSHQLHPVSYCKDLVSVLGRVLGHDDTESDRTKGKKLDNGFTGTTKRWEEIFGQRYWKSGAMYRGSSPSPVAVNPWPAYGVGKNIPPCTEYQKVLQLPRRKVVEVLLEIVGIKDLPAEHKGSLFVSFCKSQPDSFFKTSRRLRISSEYGEKQVSGFQCEPTGELVIKLNSQSQSPMFMSKAPKTLGSTSISLQNLVDPTCKLSVDKWFELASISDHSDSKPIFLHIAASFTIPTIAPFILRMVRSRPFSVNNCFFPLPGRVQQLKGWTCVVDDTGIEIMSIQMRNSEGTRTKGAKREVVGVIGLLGETQVLAESKQDGWYLLGSSYCLEKKPGPDGHIFVLRGFEMVKIFHGRKLEHEPRCCHRGKNEKDFMTAVKFSAEEPYGKAVALFNLKSGFVKFDEDWFVMPGIVLTFILSDLLRKEGSAAFVDTGDEHIEVVSMQKYVEGTNVQVKNKHDSDFKTEEVPEKISAVAPRKVGGCGSGCGEGCADSMKSSKTNGVDITSSGTGGCGGCGSGHGNGIKSTAGNGNDAKSSGCGGCGGCGSGFGDDTKSSGGCGSGCGGGCVDSMKSSTTNGVDVTSSGTGGCGGCGSGCGDGIKSTAGIGNDVKSSGCGGCGGCGGGFGDRKSSGGCVDSMKSSNPNGVDSTSSGTGGCGGCGSDCADGIKSTAGNGNDAKRSGCGGCGGCGSGFGDTQIAVDVVSV